MAGFPGGRNGITSFPFMVPPGIPVDLRRDASTSGDIPKGGGGRCSLCLIMSGCWPGFAAHSSARGGGGFLRKTPSWATFSYIHITPLDPPSDSPRNKFSRRCSLWHITCFVLCNPATCPGVLLPCLYSWFFCLLFDNRTDCLSEVSFHL